MTTENKVTCKKCGWVHLGVSRKYAEEEVTRFNAYFNTLSEEQQQLNYDGKKITVSLYEHCKNCGGSYLDFRISTQEDIPIGGTILSIIHFAES